MYSMILRQQKIQQISNRVSWLRQHHRHRVNRKAHIYLSQRRHPDGTFDVAMASGRLDDAHIWLLANRITNKQDLLDLGLKVLQLPGFTIDTVLYNQKDIELAANRALDDWRKQFLCPTEAYRNLHKAFLDHEWKNLAEELRFWVEGRAEIKVSEERFRDIQKSVRQSLLDQYENFMSVDWLPDTDTWTFPPEVYTEPCWTRIVREGMEDTTINIEKLHYIIEIFPEGSKIVVEGEAGSGKISAMANLAVYWARKSDDEAAIRLNEKFDLVFLISLKNVKTDHNLNKLIIDHHRLSEINEDEINFIVQDPCRKLLFIFDGYEDYRKGSNFAIDAAIRDRRENCFVLITSRPDYMEKRDKLEIHVEIQLLGFDKKSLKECVLKYFESEKKPKPKVKKLMKKVKKRGVFDLFRLPMMTAALCIRYSARKDLPKGEQLVREILGIYIKRTKEKGLELEESDKIVRALAELSFEASERKTGIQKVSLQWRVQDFADGDTANFPHKLHENKEILGEEGSRICTPLNPSMVCFYEYWDHSRGLPNSRCFRIDLRIN